VLGESLRRLRDDRLHAHLTIDASGEVLVPAGLGRMALRVKHNVVCRIRL